MSNDNNDIVDNFREIMKRKKPIETNENNESNTSTLKEKFKDVLIQENTQNNTECDDNKTNNNETKPRESVYKRPFFYDTSAIFGDVQPKTDKKVSIAEMVMQDGKDTPYENKEIVEKTVERERHSTNKTNVLKYLKKKQNELVSEQDKNEEHSKFSHSDCNPNPNIDTQPRKSVQQMIKENELRLKKLSIEKEREKENSLKKQKMKTRNTTSLHSGLNSQLKDIRKFIQSHNADNKISSEEFYQINKAKLSEFGITNAKDFLTVQELISYYEKSLNSNRSNSMENLHSSKKRNTVSGNSLTMALDVSEIEEENDEELGSINNSLGKSADKVKGVQNKNRQQDKKLRRRLSKTSNISCSEESFISANSLEQHLLIDEIEKGLNNQVESNEREENKPKNQINTNENLELSPSMINVNEIKVKDLSIQNNHNSFTVINCKGPSKYSYQLLIDNDSKGVNIIRDPKIKMLKNKIENFNFDLRQHFTFNPEQSSTTTLTISPTCKSYKSHLQVDNQSRLKYEGLNNSRNFLMQSSNELHILPIPRNKILEVSKTHTEIFLPKLMNQINKSTSLQIDSTKIKTEFNSPEIPAVQNAEDHSHQVIERKDSPFLQSDNNENKEERDNQIYQRPRSSIANNPQIKNILIRKDIDSTYQKNIIRSLDSIAIAQYTINKNIPLDPYFFDVLCTNCYECVKLEEMDHHSQTCVIQDDFVVLGNQDEDYNTKIFKLHESLKNKQEDIYTTKDKYLISIYHELTALVYEILINNNSIEELDRSVSKINHIMNYKLPHVTSNLKFSLLIYVYTKLLEMEKIMMILTKYEDSDDDLHIENEEVDPEQIKFMKMQLTEIENQTMKAEMELKHWRKEAKILESNLRRPTNKNEILSEIVSDVISRRNESFDQMTLVSNFPSETNDIANMKDVNEFNENFDEEEGKKYFLSLGLSLKFKYSDSIKGNVSIADLYEKARSQNIPIATWHEFIISELNIKLN